jgi:hypothetical protein
LLPRNVVSDGKFQRESLHASLMATKTKYPTIRRTERIVRRFGFSNIQALKEGQTGTACRGEEHEVTLVWSVTSGKRQITMDNQEVHYSANRSGMIDFSWTIRGNHVLKIAAYAAPPMSASPSFRQYDLFVDGQSYFDMPKVFELGLRGSAQDQARSPGDYSSYRTAAQQQEEAELQRAIQASIAESRMHLQNRGYGGENHSTGSYSGGGYGYPAPSPAPHDESTTSDLLDFDSRAEPALVPTHAPSYAAPPVAPAAAVYAPALAAQGYAAAPTAPAPLALPYAPAPGGPTYSPAPATSYYGAQAATPNTVAGPPNQFQTGQFISPGVASTASAPPNYGFPVQQPMHAPDDPFAPKAPTQNEILSDIMAAYGSQQTPATPTAGAYPAQPGFDTPAVNGSPYPHLSMSAPLALENEESTATAESEFDSALKNLVNIDDICAPADKDIKLSMAKKEEEKQKNKGKSKGLPPVANNMVGSGATLSQIQSVKPVSIRECLDVLPLCATSHSALSPGARPERSIVDYESGTSHVPRRCSNGGRPCRPRPGPSSLAAERLWRSPWARIWLLWHWVLEL